jgi:hypothetical protein
MNICLVQERPVSWNRYYSGWHWSQRRTEAHRVHARVRAALPAEVLDSPTPYFQKPVHITVTVTMSGHSLDCCNVPAKLYIDGLKGWVIADDDHRHVRSVKTVVLTGDIDAVTITIEEPK